MRTFLWGAKMTEQNVVKGDEEYTLKLKDALILKDAIFDLPKITTHEVRDEMDYGNRIPKTDFQKMIRLPNHKLMGSACPEESVTLKLFDHRPLKLSEHDNLRVSKIPREKGANFRNLPGVIVDEKNKASRDPKMAKVMIGKSGKPLVPEYAIKFVRGAYKKPLGRLWWDEIVSTVVTRAEPHNQWMVYVNINFLTFGVFVK